MAFHELKQTGSLSREEDPKDVLVWADDFNNRNIANAVYQLGVRTYGQLSELTEEQLLGWGLNGDELAIIRRILGAPGRQLRLASDVNPEQDSGCVDMPSPLPGRLAVASEAGVGACTSGDTARIIPYPEVPIEIAS